MKQIKLANDAIYTIDEASTVKAVIIPIEATSEIATLMNAFSDANLATVTFLNDGETDTVYTNLHTDSVKIVGMNVTMNLCDYDDTFQRLDELDAAVVELAELIVGE